MNAETPMPAAPAVTARALREAWRLLTPEERVEHFQQLRREDADDLFQSLSAADEAQLLLALPPVERRLWMRALPPDDAADVVQETPHEDRGELLGLLAEPARVEVTALLAYQEDDAGGLMNPRYVHLRPEMTVNEAIAFLRRQAQAQPETIYYVYVLDAGSRLLGVLSIRQLFAAAGDKKVSEIMKKDVQTVREQTDQEAVARFLAEHDLIAVPVVDADGRMKGIVTVDDIVDVVNEEATEDIQKLGGMEALSTPYHQTPFWQMVRKRAGWLMILFVGELLTATAMAHYEESIRAAVVLMLFLPLIISSGGNSGSQATTLVIRAMALGEVRLSDWAKVVRRELAVGLALGAVLAVLGLLRIVLWHFVSDAYGAAYGGLAVAVGLSLVCVVAWGTVVGSALPFVLRRFGLDPASASAPFVATLVDVSGVVIYFSVSGLLLSGTLL